MLILQPYDIAFLDIDFGDRRGAGIELARRLRQKRNDAIIIFVTNYVEYAPEGYELRAFRYLLKTDVDAKLETYFSQAVEHFTTKREVVSIQNNGEIINLAVDDILYLESEKHTVHVYMLCGNFDHYSCYASLQSFEEKLKSLGFLRIHKSYLVNMRHIKKLQCGEVVTETDSVLPVSGKNYGEIKRPTCYGKVRRHGIHKLVRFGLHWNVSPFFCLHLLFYHIGIIASERF